MMIGKAGDLVPSKGQKKLSYDIEFKKEIVVYPEVNSNRSAASHFDVGPKRVREWKKGIEKIKPTKPNKQRLDGGAKKCIDKNLEEDLLHWIYEKRSKILHVGRKMIMWKTKSIFNEKNDDRTIKDSFVAGLGWCEKIMRRYGFSLRTENKNYNCSEGSIVHD